MKKKPTTVEQYIRSAPPDSQEKLKEMRACLLSLVPTATESLKWGIPAFSYDTMLFAYAGFAHHIGLYPTPSAINHFSKELTQYNIGKGSIQFPLDEPLPLGLIKKIARFRIKELKRNDAK